MPQATSSISTIGLVCVPSVDQDSAIAFYESLGFEKRADTQFGNGYRWIEVYPPSGNTGIGLAPPPPGGSADGVETGITLPVADADAAHAEMKAAGIDVDPE